MAVRNALLVFVVALTAFASSAHAADPGGPRLTVVVDDLSDERAADILSMSPAGGMPRKLILESARQRPSWSADGSLLALGAYAYGEDLDTVVAVAEADGPGLRLYRRAKLVENPVMAPDGRTVAFSRSRLVKVLPGRENYLIKSAIWLLNVKTGRLRRLTRWRLQTSLEPSSFSPDGTKIGATMFNRKGFRAVAIDVRSGHFSLLARDGLEPSFSPYGTRFTFVRYRHWRLNGANAKAPVSDELRIGHVGRVSPARLLLRRRGFFTSPSWDPSGSRISFVHSAADELGERSFREGNKLMAINADGTCLTRVFSDPKLIVYGAAWQPGPGREAGRIEC